MKGPLAFLVLLTASVAVLSSWSTRQDSFQDSVSEALRQLYEDDQAVREAWSTKGSLTPEEAQEMRRGDEERRQEVLTILADGLLATADDHYHAAMILQHGGAPEDYLLSHVLATVGGFGGNESSQWLAAASLDRFLQSVGRPQVFGTQYTRANEGEWTQEPIDADLFPDAVRASYGVPGLAQAAERLERMQTE